MPTPRGSHLSEKHKKKLSLVLKGKIFSDETKRKISEAKKGVKRPPFSKEWRMNIGKAHKGICKGRKLSDETKRKMSEAMKGKKRPPFTEEHKRKIGESKIGKRRPNMSGENHPCWMGGISKSPYPTDWTEILKRAIRQRDSYTCQLCGKEPSIMIHHIDYDKKNCDSINLVTLCSSCHMKTNHHRDYWIVYFRE